MKVLVIAPHPDDEAIGCGGALCLHAQRGDQVAAVFLTSGERGLKHLPRDEAWKVRETEARRAASILGLAELYFLRQPDWTLDEHVAAAAAELQTVLRRESPELLYLPHDQEWHPDHQTARLIVRAALNHARIRTPKLRVYEVWTPLAAYDEVMDIGAVMPRKLRAIRAYRSQAGQFHYAQAVRGLNQYRGALAARTRYAEVFQSLKL